MLASLHLSLCTHTCIHIYICVCVHIYIHTYMDININVYVYIGIDLDMDIDIYMCTRMHLHKYNHTYVHTYLPTYLPIYLPTHIHTCMHACIIIHVCVAASCKTCRAKHMGTPQHLGRQEAVYQELPLPPWQAPISECRFNWIRESHRNLEPMQGQPTQIHNLG